MKFIAGVSLRQGRPVLSLSGPAGSRSRVLGCRRFCRLISWLGFGSCRRAWVTGHLMAFFPALETQPFFHAMISFFLSSQDFPVCGFPLAAGLACFFPTVWRCMYFQRHRLVFSMTPARPIRSFSVAGSPRDRFQVAIPFGNIPSSVIQASLTADLLSSWTPLHILTLSGFPA